MVSFRGIKMNEMEMNVIGMIEEVRVYYVISRLSFTALMSIQKSYISEIALKVFLFTTFCSSMSQINCLGASRSSMFSHGSLPFLSMTGMSRNMHPRRGSRFTVRADAVSVPILFPLQNAYISALLLIIILITFG